MPSVWTEDAIDGLSVLLKGSDYSSTPLSAGDMFQDPQWIPETTDST